MISISPRLHRPLEPKRRSLQRSRLVPTVLFSVAVLAAIANPQSAWSAPRIACRQVEYSFGTVEDGKAVEHVFTIWNDGDAPLLIGDIRACCGAHAAISSKTIMPGTNAALNVVFPLQGRSGEQKKSFYVASNDPKEPYCQLRLTGVVVPPLDIQPRFLDLGTLENKEPASREVVVACRSNAMFQITNAVTGSECFSVTVKRGQLQSQWSVRIQSAANMPIGITRSKVVLYTDSKDYPQIEIPVMATVVSDLVAVPGEILLAESATPKPVTRYAAVRSRSNRPFRILKIEKPEPDANTRFDAIISGGYRITIGNLMPLEDLNGKDLIVLTDHEQVKRLAIPFRVVAEKEGAPIPSLSPKPPLGPQGDGGGRQAK